MILGINTKYNLNANSLYDKKNKAYTPIFKGNELKFSKTAIDKISQEVDNILGEDKFFASTLESLNIKSSNGDLILKKTGFFNALFKTIKYPFVDMPLDITNTILTLMKKTPLKNTAQKLSKNQVLKKRALIVQKDKDYKVISEILNNYFADDIPVQKGLRKFKSDVTSGICKTLKKYNSSDERTLNRIITATVSAVYSGWDFYNISMLQKDNKDSAKKAQKDRFKQEMTRMALNGGLTYLILGTLDKHVNPNLMAKSCAIASGALIAEVLSRVVNHTPLYPLNSEEAELIHDGKKVSFFDRFKKRKNKNDDTPANNSTNYSFKANEKIFSEFTNSRITAKKSNTLPQSLPEKENKGNTISILKKILIASAASCGFYFLSKGVKGEYQFKNSCRKFYKDHSNEIDNYLKNKRHLSNKSSTKIKYIVHNKEKNEKYDVSKIIKNLITTKNRNVMAQDIIDDIERLQKTNEGKEISNLLELYKDNIKSLSNKNNTVINVRTNRNLISGVYNGITRLTGMIYRVLSLPARGIDGIIDKIFFKKSESAMTKTIEEARLNLNKIKKEHAKQTAELIKIFDKNKNKKDNYKIIADEIKAKTRNFEKNGETGELANLSRTMVTAIATYFFVNDYSNKVLIESAGKNKEKAREERNDRIAQKIANFIINGVLMNLFNSIFKTSLNNSLTQATIIAGATETTNEFLVRKSICQPIGPKKSKQDIIDYENKKINQKGIGGAWSKLYRKMTGKKTLTEKAGLSQQQ